MRKYISLLCFLMFSLVNAQELNCTVVVNADKVTNVNPQVFKTLEKSLNDFMNKTDWTEKTYSDNQKVNCSMFVTITSYDSNNVEASIQVQSSRNTYNSTYSSPILNINDKDFSFPYVEFQNIIYNANSYDSNLISTLAFYAYIILGVDAESYKLDSGKDFLALAQNVASLAMTSGSSGWTQSDKGYNRYTLINDIMSTTFKPYREALFQYHLQGLDKMAADLKAAKDGILNAINTLETLQDLRPNSYLTKIFFDAKSDEIVSVFTGGPVVKVDELLNNLNKLSPTNTSKWSQIVP